MSRHKTHIIYLPGLGDSYDVVRRACLSTWRLYGASVELVPSGWVNDEVLEAKVDRIKHAARVAADKGYRVVLLGESAGGSLALNTYAGEVGLVSGIVTLCGKNSQPENVSPRLYRRNKAFHTSMQRVGLAAKQLTREQRQRVTSIYPLYDAYVPRADTLIPDCREVKLYAVGHITSILFGLTFGAFVLIREARRLGRSV